VKVPVSPEEKLTRQAHCQHHAGEGTLPPRPRVITPSIRASPLKIYANYIQRDGNRRRAAYQHLRLPSRPASAARKRVKITNSSWQLMAGFSISINSRGPLALRANSGCGRKWVGGRGRPKRKGMPRTGGISPSSQPDPQAKHGAPPPQPSPLVTLPPSPPTCPPAAAAAARPPERPPLPPAAAVHSRRADAPPPTAHVVHKSQVRWPRRRCRRPPARPAVPV